MPSPFVGTETWTNPSFPAASPYLPPFNRISAYREPGRINLNTIYSPQVFNGLMSGGFPAATDLAKLWQHFMGSRQGRHSSRTNYCSWRCAAAGIPMPTEFANPFRSFGGVEHDAELHAAGDGERNRLHSAARGGGSIGNSHSTSPCSNRLPPRLKPYNNMNRNPFFRYQGLERLENLVTTRSNVYAVWITVGYFEVETAAQVTAQHPGWTAPTPALSRRLSSWPRVGHRHGRNPAASGLLYHRPHHTRRLPTRPGPERRKGDPNQPVY